VFVFGRKSRGQRQIVALALFAQDAGGDDDLGAPHACLAIAGAVENR